MSYRENVAQIALAKIRLSQELEAILRAFPEDYRGKCRAKAEQAHAKLYRPYWPSETIAHYDRDFWHQLELILPWQRDLRELLMDVDEIGSSTVNRLYRMAYVRSPESPKGGHPSIRGWASIAATVRESPESLREVAENRGINPLSRVQLIALRTELVDWYLS